MRFISSLLVMAIASSASAGFVSSAMIDDFSGPAGLGFSRAEQSGALVGGGSGFLSNNAGLQYLRQVTSDSGFNATGYTGVSLKVNGDLGTGGLFLSVMGADFN
ncbi:MAG: hypothetical protein ACKPBA_09810, partial [Planctomycetota bacterium]